MVMKPNGKKKPQKSLRFRIQHPGFQMQKRVFPQSVVTYKNHIEWKYKKGTIYLSI